MRVRNPLPYVDINTTNAVVEIRNHPVRLKVESEPAQMRVKRTAPTFKVNWKALRAQSGQRSPDYQRRHMQGQYQQQFYQGVRNMVGDTERMGALHEHKKGGPEIVASVAHRRMSAKHKRNYNMEMLPKDMPKIEWQPGSVEIEWDPYRLEMSWEGDIYPEISVTPHTVEIRLINGETVRVGENEAKSIEMRGFGRRIDQEV